MMQTMLAMALTLTLAAAPALPVGSVHEAAQVATGTSSAACPGGEPIMVLRLALAEGPFTLFVARERFIFVDEHEGDETPVWFGTVGRDERASLSVSYVRAFREVREASPCAWLVATGA